MQISEDRALADAERDVRDLKQHVADRQIRIGELHTAGRDDDELKSCEGLFLLSDALELARRRLPVECSAGYSILAADGATVPLRPSRRLGIIGPVRCPRSAALRCKHPKIATPP
jgi:hypothetical protein